MKMQLQLKQMVERMKASKFVQIKVPVQLHLDMRMLKTLQSQFTLMLAVLHLHLHSTMKEQFFLKLMAVLTKQSRFIRIKVQV